METAGYDSSRPLAEQVAQRIKDYILEEKLKSGDKLPTETALAREMGVARSTVREAIKRLESQNILTVRHGAGSFVTDQPGLADDPLGLDFIEDKERLAFDLLEVRNIIEPAIAALAARHATPEDIAEMESLYNLMEYHILHGQDYLDEDMKFHRTIARASGNLVAPQLAPIITASALVAPRASSAAAIDSALVSRKPGMRPATASNCVTPRESSNLHVGASTRDVATAKRLPRAASASRRSAVCGKSGISAGVTVRSNSARYSAATTCTSCSPISVTSLIPISSGGPIKGSICSSLSSYP